MLIDKEVQSHEFLTAQDLLQRDTGRTLRNHSAVILNLFLHSHIRFGEWTQTVH